MRQCHQSIGLNRAWQIPSYPTRTAQFETYERIQKAQTGLAVIFTQPSFLPARLRQGQGDPAMDTLMH